MNMLGACGGAAWRPWPYDAANVYEDFCRLTPVMTTNDELFLPYAAWQRGVCDVCPTAGTRMGMDQGISPGIDPPSAAS